MRALFLLVGTNGCGIVCNFFSNFIGNISGCRVDSHKIARCIRTGIFEHDIQRCSDFRHNFRFCNIIQCFNSSIGDFGA